MRPVSTDEAAGLDREQPERGVEDHAGEAHAADRRPEQLGVAVGAELDDRGRRRACSDIRVTWLPNEPSTWWFLPWMSLAIAPPMVTNRVPGVTGTKKPRGTIIAQQVVDADPGRHGDRAGRVVDRDGVVRRHRAGARGRRRSGPGRRTSGPARGRSRRARAVPSPRRRGRPRRPRPGAPRSAWPAPNRRAGHDARKTIRRTSQR